MVRQMDETLANLPILLFDTPRQWEEWLGMHHARPQGVWLKFAKKGTGVSTISYAEALDVALCYGWIDARKRSCDETFWLQQFTPRRPKSVWSKVNTEHVARLIEGGRMTPAGQKEIDAAKADGRWDAAYQSQSDFTLPDDFQAELEQHPEARAFFETLNKVNRYAIYHRIVTANKPETRRARIEKFIAMLAAHEKLHP